MENNRMGENMNVPLQLIVLSVPSLIYVAVRRRRGEKWGEAFGKVGWQGCPPIYFLWGLGIIVLGGGLGWLAYRLIPLDILAGWLLGWLRYRSDSILPGWLVHSLSNAFGALAAMT
jgi:membrane protease YdiL (CAAX protease family)